MLTLMPQHSVNASCSGNWLDRRGFQVSARSVPVDPPQDARHHAATTTNPAVHSNQPSPPINLPAAVLPVMQK